MSGSPRTEAERAGAYEVLVVGAGPTGLGLALELAHDDVDCLVLERHPTPQPIPKGQNLTQRTMEHLRTWGVEDEVRAARVLPAGYPSGGLTAYGSLLGEYWYPWYRRDSVNAYYHVANERLPQYRTEAVLRAAVGERSSAELRVGVTVDRIVQDDDGVEVGAVDRDGRRLTVRATHVVGCDGSRSTVRQQAAIELHTPGASKVMLLAVFRSAELARLFDRYPDTSYFNALHPDLDGYWRFLGRVDAEEAWFFHAPIGDRASTEDVDVARMLFDAVGRSFDFDLDHVGFWDSQIAIASTYRHGRVFLAGDAAHSHPPYGGFGINTGFEDARNLGWKLRAVSRGWGDQRLLDTYDEERRPVFESTARDFIMRFVEVDRDFVRTVDPDRDREAFEREWQRRASGGNADVHAFAPHYRGSPIVVDDATERPSAVGEHGFEAQAGCHLPPVEGWAVGDRCLIDDLGTGFALLNLGGDPELVSAFEERAAERGLPLTTVGDLPPSAAAAYGASLVLVRPDHYVAWTDADTTTGPDEILGRVTGVGE